MHARPDRHEIIWVDASLPLLEVVADLVLCVAELGFPLA
jgi:hypothetical protein